MTLDWQTSISLALVLMAVVYLGLRAWRIVIRRSAGCGACSNCPAEQAAGGKPLVTLDSLSKPKTQS